MDSGPGGGRRPRDRYLLGMDWSFRLLMLFSAAFAVAAVDHYVFGEALTGMFGQAGRAVLGE